MYKRRFAAWGWRKNIRTLGEYDQIVNAGTTSRFVGKAAVSLSNGQVIDVRRLAIHVGRRQEYLRATRKHPDYFEQRQSWTCDPTAIRTLTAPGNLRIPEAALYYTKAYIQGRYQGAITAEAVENLRMGLENPPGLEWNIFAGTVGQLVEEDKFNEALVLSESGRFDDMYWHILFLMS